MDKRNNLSASARPLFVNSSPGSRALPAFLLLYGCSGQQSALAPAGDEAAWIAHLFWIMAGAGGLIWLAVMIVLLHALRANRVAISARASGRIILWCGAVLPAASLLLLLSYALWLMPSLRPFGGDVGDDPVRVEVTGRQYWWDVVYQGSAAGVRTANEIVLPVGRRAEFSLRSTDVIHSFWIPALGGKMDMIPGRTNRLSLRPTKPGVYRGPCAEYCGTSHTFMALDVIVLPADEFEQWAARRRAPSTGVDATGADLFLRHGCGACHRVAGTMAAGEVGPDLSHVGSRRTIAASMLPNTQANLARFIAEPAVVKPGAEMPAFGMLPPEDIRLIAEWLKGLR